MKKFKVKEFIEILGDWNIIISDFNKVQRNGEEIIYWEGVTDDYFKERPYGDYDVMHITRYNADTIVIMIDKEVENQTSNCAAKTSILDSFRFVGNWEQGGYVCPKCGHLINPYHFKSVCEKCGFQEQK